VIGYLARLWLGTVCVLLIVAPPAGVLLLIGGLMAALLFADEVTDG
jgi:hypothetical protein